MPVMRVLAFLLGLLCTAPSWADLFALPAGAGTQNGTSLANACNGSNDSDCGTNAPAGTIVRLCDPGTGFTQSSSWANSNANAGVRWSGNCSAFGYAARARIRNSGGAYNLNWLGAGSGTFEDIDFDGGGSSDCVSVNATGALIFRRIGIRNCVGDALDIDALTGGLAYESLTIEDVSLNGLFCNNSRVVGTGFVGRRVGTAGANNTDTIGIDDGCGPGSRLSSIYIEDQRGDLGGAIDLQDSTSPSQAIVTSFYLVRGEGAGLTMVSNNTPGTAGGNAWGGIIDSFKFSVYLKDTPGTHRVYNVTTIRATNTEAKFGDNGTSGDEIAGIDSRNNIFGGGACATGTAALYWRNNASVSVTSDNNRYCSNGVFQLASGGNTTFAGWKAASSQDANSALEDDPGFVEDDPHGPDGFCLKPSSTFLAAGGYLGAWATGLENEDLGKPPAIGARALCNYRRAITSRRDAGTRRAVTSRRAAADRRAL